MYNKEMKYLLFYLVSLSALAQNVPQCPKEAYLIEYVSPLNGIKKSFCGYQKDGQITKHGEEFIFSAKGEVIEKISYHHGKENEAAIPQDKNNTVSDEKLLASIHNLIEILTLKKNYAQKNRFKVNDCDKRPADWLKGALFNTPITKSYSFSENCDVTGNFEAKFDTEFVMNFKLRNLDDLNNTSLKVIMSLNKKGTDIRYKFLVIEGTISSPSRQGKFTAEYQVDINPMTGDAVKETQAGKITLTKVNDKEVNLTQNIEF